MSRVPTMDVIRGSTLWRAINKLREKLNEVISRTNELPDEEEIQEIKDSIEDVTQDVSNVSQDVENLSGVVANKLNKNETPATYDRAYIVNNFGVNGLTSITEKKVAYTIPKRDINNNFKVGTPTDDEHVANKKYIDDVIEAIEPKPYTLLDTTDWSSVFEIDSSIPNKVNIKKDCYIKIIDGNRTTDFIELHKNDFIYYHLSVNIEINNVAIKGTSVIRDFKNFITGNSVDVSFRDLTIVNSNDVSYVSSVNNNYMSFSKRTTFSTSSYSGIYLYVRD